MVRTVWLNGDFLPEDQAKLPIFDRGLLFADAVYEGLGVLDGQIVGIVGCLVGVAVGLAICAMLGQYGLKLDPKVYYLEHLPIVVNPLELVGVCVGAMILATVATLFPAIKAARMKPVDGLTMRGGVRAPTPHEGGNA